MNAGVMLDIGTPKVNAQRLVISRIVAVDDETVLKSHVVCESFASDA